MPVGHVAYFARLRAGDCVEHPSGLVRRRYLAAEETIDEAFLYRDQLWGPTEAITDQEWLGTLGYDLEEIDEPAVQVIIARWRREWEPENAARMVRMAASEATDPLDYWIVTSRQATANVSRRLMRRRYICMGEDGVLDQELTRSGTWVATTGICDAERGQLISTRVAEADIESTLAQFDAHHAENVEEVRPEPLPRSGDDNHLDGA